MKSSLPGLRIESRECSPESGWHVPLGSMQPKIVQKGDLAVSHATYMILLCCRIVVGKEHLLDGLKRKDVCYAASNRRFAGLNMHSGRICICKGKR